MIPFALAALCGAVGLHTLPRLPSVWLAAPLLCLTFLCLRHRRTRLLAVCLAAFLWSWWQAGARLAQDLPAALEGRDLLLRGTLVSLPEIDGRATRFVFRARAREQDGAWIDFTPTLRLSWYEAPPLHAGEGWQLQVRLKRRHGFRNPGGFDYAGWLFQNGIAGTGYVRGADRAQPWPALATRRPDVRLRAAVERELQPLLAHARAAGLLRALTLGAADGISAQDWETFRATGTSHLVSISGLHIGLVAGLGFFCGRWLWSRSHRLTQRFAAPRAAAVIALLAATLYAALAGFSIPTRRAWIMALTLLAGTLLSRPVRPAHSLALALILLLIHDSFAVLSPGFWLSFVAVAIIFLQQTQPAAARGWRASFRQLLRLQFALTLGLLPFTLLFFGQAGWVAPVANLIAVPWTSLLLVPLLFAALLCLFPLPWLAQWLFFAADWTAQCLLEALGGLANLPGAVIGMPQTPPAVSVAALCGAGLLLLPRGLPQRGLGALMLLPLLLWTPPRPAPGTAWFTLLDVGQGLAAVVQTARHTLVYDTGPRFSPEFDTGSAVVAPFLAAQGIGHVDALVVSHGDNDHSGGAEALDRRMPVYRLLTSVPRQFGWRRSRPCLAGQAWTWDGVEFRMLHPHGGAASENDASCVLQIRAADGTRLLLPGDIEAPAERELVARYGGALRSEILVAPHHGSRTSSTPAFVEAVAPGHVLFAAGYRNRYGFPNPRVLERYRGMNTEILVTASDGAIRFRLGTPGGAQPERDRIRHYWAAAVPPGQ